MASESFTQPSAKQPSSESSSTGPTSLDDSDRMGHMNDVFLAAQPKGSMEEYEPLRLSFSDEAYDGVTSEDEGVPVDIEVPFSWWEYAVFTAVGIAMLWAWNMFLTAAPYFATRFASSPWISKNFQSAILSSTTAVNLAGMVLLTRLQKNANYPRRVIIALIINLVAFLLLTMSTSYFLDVSAAVYFIFLMINVVCAAFATALFQNGSLAFASSFSGRPEYLQAIMAGQGVAGVLPPLAQMLSVLAVPDTSTMDAAEASKTIATSAFIYFLTAVGVSLAVLVAFLPIARRSARADHTSGRRSAVDELHGDISPSTRELGFLEILRKLPLLLPTIFLCFVVSMFFPVFTAKVLSVRPAGPTRPRLFEPAAYIPLGFFWWNLGDLVGRISTSLRCNAMLRRRPIGLFVLSMVRWGFIPLYLLCNIGGRGAVINSDLFYLVFVQFPFGLTNGLLASNAMMAAAEMVGDDEKEATGGYMGLGLVSGLTVGSLLSFSVAGI